jgi:hypothetical protein
MIDNLTKPETVAGVVAVLGGIVLTLKKLGLNVSFGKANGKSNGKCPDPECHASVEQVAKDLSEVKEEFKSMKKEMFPKINGTAEAVARIEGYIEGLKNRQPNV